MTDTPEPIDLRSHDTAADKTAELLRLLPEICTKVGKIDIDSVKIMLGEARI